MTRGMTEAEMRERVSQARIARLATLSPVGAPHLVPLCFCLQGESLYSAVDGKPKRTPALQRLANVAADPRVCVLIDHYEESWGRLWWIRLDGIARRLPAGPATASAIGLLAAKYVQYRAAIPPGPVLAIELRRWTGWAAEAA